MASARFTDNNDGSITDHEANLMWTREDSWQTQANWLTWDEAKQYAQELNNDKFAGYQDWRLPYKYELEMLYDPTKPNKDKYNKEIGLNPVFPEGSLTNLWASDGVGGDGFALSLATGEMTLLYKSKSGRMASRPVRGKHIAWTEHNVV